MIAVVDPDICIGCGLCVETCSSVFQMEGDKATVVVDVVPVEVEESCRDAMMACPVDAISMAP